MRIGIFTDCYKPSLNGVTTSINTYKKELEKRNHEVFIFCPSVDGAKDEKNVFRLPSIEDLSPDNYPIGFPFLPIINSTIKPLKLDIVHTQLPFLVGNLGHRVAKKLGLPEVHTYHTHLTEYAHYGPAWFIQPLVKKGLKYLSKSFCDKSDIVIAPSNSIRKILHSYGVVSPIAINPTGVDLKKFRKLDLQAKSDLFQKYGIPMDKKIILFAGRLAKEKNLDFLLKSFSIVNQSVNNSYLIFAGGGPAEDGLRARITKLGLEDKVTITGFLEHSEIAKFYGTSDLFAFPSLTETQGIVILEAMAAGNPVVAINAMGQKDIINHDEDGYLSKTNINDFSKYIINILEDEELQKRLSYNAEINVRQFSIEMTTDRLIKIYEMAIRAKQEKNSGKSKLAVIKLLKQISPF